MITVDFKTKDLSSRKQYTNNSLIRITYDNETAKTDNWGDDDCLKMITTVNACTITIDKSIARDFINKIIRFIRWDYYKPAVFIEWNENTLIHRKLDKNGNLTYTVEINQKPQT